MIDGFKFLVWFRNPDQEWNGSKLKNGTGRIELWIKAPLIVFEPPLNRNKRSSVGCIPEFYDFENFNF